MKKMETLYLHISVCSYPLTRIPDFGRERISKV